MVYVLIDYENVRPEALPGLKANHVRVMVFVGAHQNKLTFGFVSAMQALGRRARYIKINGQGRNALDFHLAFYIGQLAARDPDATFYIVSRDTGFDALIGHLQALRIKVARSPKIEELPLLSGYRLPMPNTQTPSV